MKGTTTMNISLPAELAKFVRDKVEGGQYTSAGEVVREALRLLAASGRPGSMVADAPLCTLNGSAYQADQALAAARSILSQSSRRSLGGTPIEDLINDGREK